MEKFLKSVNTEIINPIIAVLFIVAVVVFVWGVVVMIAKSDSEEALTKGKKNMMYGIFGIFIMTSVFFLMQMIVNTFELKDPEGNSPIKQVIG